MTRRPHWRCKVCRTWGVGGPEHAVVHLRTTHCPPGWGVAAQTETARLPDYASDSNRSTKWAVRPPIAFGFTGGDA